MEARTTPDNRETDAETHRPEPDQSSTETKSDACPECSGDLLSNGDETVCEDCGLIVEEDTIDHGPEWRSFDDETRCRVGLGHTERRHDNGLGSEIGFDEVSNPQKRKRVARMRKHDSRAKFSGKKDRNLGEGLAETRRICDQLHASDSLVDRACRLFRVGHDANLAVGESIDGLAAAAVLATIREQSMPLPLSEVVDVTECTTREVVRLRKALYDVADVEATLVEPVEHVPRICSGVDVTEETRTTARELTIVAQEEALHVGKDPSGVAAGAVYVAVQMTNGVATQRDIADVADVAAHTLRDRYHELVEDGVAEEVAGRGN